MKLPKEGFYSKFNHVEVGRYDSRSDRMFREGKGLVPWANIYDYAAKHDNTGIYHSIRHYDLEQGGLDGPSLASPHFDIDNKENPDKALADTRKIVDYLIERAKVPYEAINVHFSGMKGFHVNIEPMAIKVNLIQPNSAAIFRYIATEMSEELGLDSIDFAVYDLRRMWRLAGSRHQKTGLYKKPCKNMLDASIDQIAKSATTKPTEEELDVPEPDFCSSAAMFFSEKVAVYEAKLREREEDKLNNFLANGHSKSSFSDDALKQFTPEELKKKCPAVEDLIEKAERTKNLDHYERLFLCSLLTYTPESIEYLQGILSKLSDYNFEISNLHIQDWVMRRQNNIGGRPYTCLKAKTVGIVCSGCDDMQPKTYEDNLGSGHIADPSPVRFAYKYH